MRQRGGLSVREIDYRDFGFQEQSLRLSVIEDFESGEVQLERFGGLCHLPYLLFCLIKLWRSHKRRQPMKIGGEYGGAKGSRGTQEETRGRKYKVTWGKGGRLIRGFMWCFLISTKAGQKFGGGITTTEVEYTKSVWALRPSPLCCILSGLINGVKLW